MTWITVMYVQGDELLSILYASLPTSHSDSICQSLILYSVLHLSMSQAESSYTDQWSLISNSGSRCHFLSAFCLL